MTIPTDELIPCGDELNRLKEFLADFKKPWASRVLVAKYYKDFPPCTLEEFMKPSARFLEMNARVRAENRQGWINAIKGGTPFPKNYGGPYKEYWTWAGGRITPKY